MDRQSAKTELSSRQIPKASVKFSIEISLPFLSSFSSSTGIFNPANAFPVLLKILPSESLYILKMLIEFYIPPRHSTCMWRLMSQKDSWKDLEGSNREEFPKMQLILVI